MTELHTMNVDNEKDDITKKMMEGAAQKAVREVLAQLEMSNA